MHKPSGHGGQILDVPRKSQNHASEAQTDGRRSFQVPQDPSSGLALDLPLYNSKSSGWHVGLEHAVGGSEIMRTHLRYCPVLPMDKSS